MSSVKCPEPDLRWLRACYFFFFSILGIMVPYLGVFFDSRGFNAQEIGFLLAILMATRIVAPNVWAAVADRTGMRSELIKLGSCAAAITYISFFFDGSFVYLAISLAIYTFFWNAILAQLEVITLETLGDKAERYGAIRSWGSVGYIVLVISGGLAIDYWGPEVLPYMGMILFLGLFACSLPLPANRSVVVNKSERPKLKLDASLVWFMLSAMLLQMSVGPFYGFFVLYLKQVGYSETIAGLLVALGVLAEIVIFFYSSRLIRQYGIRVLLVVSILLTVIRWLLLAFGVEYASLLIISQLLHAFTFGLVHAASIHFIHRHFNVSHRSTGQALYASVSFGVGGALGTWISGMIWGDGSQIMWVWIFAASCAFLSMLAVMMIPNINGEASANAPQS
ncbi:MULTISPECIES: MFS transporter [Shewanella]|uniref:MFS transporter n=1 Tax=Shewanella psychromarinicola TaxID=2487742 RepID=A0A3N4DNY3_9GAMM|nr:MFS transporter [Shewanella psychromarinicola]AZG35622.1 MFS transporter [Shewanella psychromarinicola]MCL1081350.1 MFS transporter [Shewanella psychromarinicola]RPA27629.1 MFS transporter [Shewanella psychromarinicola]